MSKMDEALLTKIASETGGEYFKADNGNIDIPLLLDKLNGLEKKQASSRLNRQFEDRYQYFLFLSLLLLLLEYFIPETKKQIPNPNIQIQNINQMPKSKTNTKNT